MWGKLGTKLLFSTTCHPQTDGQTEVVNRTLSMLLRAILKKNLKMWEECLPHVEFAYNRAVHSTTKVCPFELAYGFKPTAPIDLLPLPLQERVNLDANERAKHVRKIHQKARENIAKMTQLYERRANKGRKKMLFEPGDLVWVHLRKDRFPDQRKCKLQPRADGPFKVVQKINDNAYKIDLPSKYGVSETFNVSDLSPYFGPNESRTTPFQGGEDDEDIPTFNDHAEDDHLRDQDILKDQQYQGPITRRRAKQILDQVNANLELIPDLNNLVVLPMSSSLIELRCIGEEQGGPENQRVLQSLSA